MRLESMKRGSWCELYVMRVMRQCYVFFATVHHLPAAKLPLHFFPTMKMRCVVSGEGGKLNGKMGHGTIPNKVVPIPIVDVVNVGIVQALSNPFKS